MNPPTPMTDQEREAHILDCGRLMQKAMLEGDADEARRWLAAEMEAIAGRSPEQQAQMTAAIEERISSGVCYFQAVGAEHAAELSREGQAA